MLKESELFQSLSGSLGKLGLTEHEKNLYILSLQLGPTSIANLAKHLNIPRPNVYKVITGLERRGLTHFSARKNRYFMVETPTKILSLLNEQKDVLEQEDHKIRNLIPDLLALYQQGDLPTSIRIFQGEEAFRNLFFQSIDEAKDDIRFFGSVHDFIGFISWASEKEWIKRRLSKKLHMKSLVLPSPEAEALQKDDVSQMRETRIMSASKTFVTSFQLFANKVIFWQPKSPVAILIEDEYITTMLNIMFDLLWDKNAGPKTN